MEFVILGIPQAKQSVKFTKSGMKYTPAHIKQAQNSMTLQIMNQLPNGHEPITEAVAIQYTFEFPLTKDLKKETRQKIQCGDQVFRPKKPDIDNLQKAVNDAMNGVVYLDDSQIVKISSVKIYSETPKIIINVQPLRN